MTPSDSVPGPRPPAAIDPSLADRDRQLQNGVRRLVQVFSDAASSVFDLTAGLAALCREATAALGPDSASVWLHDRQSRELVLTASTHLAETATRPRLPVDSPELAAVALREVRARHATDESNGASRSRVSIPLRGRRRALGVLILEGMDRHRAVDPHFLAHADDLGYRLSSAIENLQLLKDVVQSRQELAQAERLASLGRFVAGIAHELNNPLQGVLGHLELLRREGRVPTGIRRELRIVAREAERAARIVGNLLVFAGGRTAPKRPIRLNTLVSQAVALRAPSCKAARIAIASQLDKEHPRVMANRVLLQQALLNILVNAEQELTAAGGGRIDVSTHVVWPDGVVRLRVRDTGPGIASEALPRVFEPFYSTKEVGRGTGLGLATAYGTVKDHGGTLAADNHPDGGAVFTIELPVVADPRPAARRSR
jgi:C4-dicarboxylate-specific signal transduction histidine kinase